MGVGVFRRISHIVGVGILPYCFPALRVDWPKFQAIIKNYEKETFHVVPATDSKLNDREKRGQFMGGQAVQIVLHNLLS